MNKFKKFLIENYKLFILLFLFLFFFSYPVLVLYDSAHYIAFVKILEGNALFSSWDIARGPVFPLLIFLSNIFFGKTTIGLLILSFSFYFLMLLVVKKILEAISIGSNKLKVLLYIVFFFVIIINPIVFGYYHALLTEFVAMSISLLSCYLSWILYLYSQEKECDRKKLIMLTAYFVIMTPFSWFLKQPYVSITLFPLIVATILQLFSLKGYFSKIRMVAITVLSLISLFGGIFLWNSVLKRNGVSLDSDRNVTTSVGNLLIGGLGEYQRVESINNNKEYKIVEILNRNGEVVDSVQVKIDDLGNITTRSALGFLPNVLLHHPGKILDSYITNYLGLINIYKSSSLDGVEYIITEKKILPFGCVENCAIATSILDHKSNIYYMTEEMYASVLDYEQYIDPPFLSATLLKINTKPSILLFNWLLFVLPFILLVAIIFKFTYKRHMSIHSSNILILSIILLSYSFLHIFVHVVTSAIMDRYASPAYIPAVIGLISLLVVLNNEVFRKKRKKG